MKLLTVAVFLVAVLLFLRHRRQVVKRRRQRHYRPVRVFAPGSDPFKERFEFYAREEDAPDSGGEY